MDVHEVYQYSELVAEDAIRLIHLQPSDDLEAGVECFLKDATLADYRDNIGDHYIALSYVWGDQTDIRSISVDGRRLEITASLDSALRYIRDYRRVLRVWADGVCIDQKDTHDRNRQVRLMGDVYSTAQHTIIFLGLSSPRCDVVMLLIISGTQPSGKSEEDPVIPSRNLLDGSEAIVEEEILTRPWFTRVWILQELVLSQNPWIQLGRFRIKWLPFCRSILSSKTSLWKPDSRAILEHMSDTRNEFTKTNQSISQERQEVMGESLFNLLKKRRVCGLSDPKDLFYAHLGLVDAGTRNLISIDYDKSIIQVYEDMTQLYMNWIGAGIMLSLAEQSQLERRPRSLPSWAIDWSSQLQFGERSHGKDGTYNPFNIQTYNTLYYKQRKSSRTFSFEVPHIMAVCGWYIGTIETIIPLSSLPKRGLPFWVNYEPLSQSEMILSLLGWVLREDNEALRTRRHLVDFVAAMPPANAELEKSVTTGWPKLKGPQKKNLAQVVSIMSEWPELTSALLAETKTTSFKFIVTTWTKELFIRRCIRFLISMLAFFNDTEPIAALAHTNMFVQVPSSVHAGDHVVDLWLGEDNFEILRPHETVLSAEEELMVREDFARQGIDNPEAGDTTTPRFSNCRFIAIKSELWRESEYYGYKGENYTWDDTYKSETNRRLFALH